MQLCLSGILKSSVSSEVNLDVQGTFKTRARYFGSLLKGLSFFIGIKTELCLQEWY